MHRNTKYWAFTWQTNVSQKQLPREETLKIYLNHISEEFHFQREKGDKLQKQHYQGCLILNGPRQSKKQVLDLFEAKFRNVGGLTLSKIYDKQSVVSYVTKETGRISGPFHGGTKYMFDEEISNATLYPWQFKLYGFLMDCLKDAEFRDRKIIWIEDQIGNTGKSFFQKWLRVGQQDISVRKLPVSTVERLISAITKIIKDQTPDMFMINLTRSKGEGQSFNDLFAAIEDIKDGYVADTMYGKYVECVFKPPLVVVFANFSPSDYTQLLSPDRWLILTINVDKEIKYYQRNSNGFGETIIPHDIEWYTEKYIKK